MNITTAEKLRAHAAALLVIADQLEREPKKPKAKKPRK